MISVTVSAVSMVSKSTDELGLVLYGLKAGAGGVGGEVAYVIDASEDTFTEDYSGMALTWLFGDGWGFDTGDVALTLYGKGGYDFYLIL